MKDTEPILKEKSIAVLNPYQIHRASIIDKNCDGLYALYLDRTWIEKFQIGLCSVNEYISFPKNILNDVKINKQFLVLCKNLFSNDFCIDKEEQVVEFVSKLILKSSSVSVIEPRNILPCDIKEFIDKNLDSNFSLEKIAQEFLITPFHLIRIFKKELNLTPYQYILNKKIHLAKELLSTDMSISEVALSSGFNDQSHLYKYFKQFFSISPKEYQQSLIK